jgi:hypothetical protein
VIVYEGTRGEGYGAQVTRHAACHWGGGKGLPTSSLRSASRPLVSLRFDPLICLWWSTSTSGPRRVCRCEGVQRLDRLHGCCHAQARYTSQVHAPCNRAYMLEFFFCLSLFPLIACSNGLPIKWNRQMPCLMAGPGTTLAFVPRPIPLSHVPHSMPAQQLLQLNPVIARITPFCIALPSHFKTYTGFAGNVQNLAGSVPDFQPGLVRRRPGRHSAAQGGFLQGSLSTFALALLLLGSDGAGQQTKEIKRSRLPHLVAKPQHDTNAPRQSTTRHERLFHETKRFDCTLDLRAKPCFPPQDSDLLNKVAPDKSWLSGGSMSMGILARCPLLNPLPPALEPNPTPRPPPTRVSLYPSFIHTPRPCSVPALPNWPQSSA